MLAIACMGMTQRERVSSAFDPERVRLLGEGASEARVGSSRVS